MSYQLVREYHERLLKEFGGTKKLPTTFKSWTKGAVTRKIENVFKDFLMDRLNEEDKIDTYTEPIPDAWPFDVSDTAIIGKNGEPLYDEPNTSAMEEASADRFDSDVGSTDSDATPPWEEQYTGVSEP